MSSAAPARPAPAAPTDPVATVDAVIAQLAAQQAQDPSAFSSDALTKAILERLNQDVARLYAEAQAEGGEQSDEEDEDGEDDAGGDGSGNGDGGRKVPRVQLPKGPKPVDLWKAAHEVDRAPKEKVVLKPSEWEDLVSRLNESSKKKQLMLLTAQQRQMADQLTGLTFKPFISENSRKLAANNPRLPERVAALMHKKKAKLDRIRTEKAEKELEEATFKPNLDKSKVRGEAMVRRIGHLMQYEIDRRVRAEQRRILIEDMERRELTFSPVINRNSARIVNRLKKENEPRPEGGEGGDASGAKATRAALAEAITAAATSSKPLGRSYLPGHEEETFHPRINARSAALVRGTDVYNRLYKGSGADAGSKSPRSRSDSIGSGGAAAAAAATAALSSSNYGSASAVGAGGAGGEGAGEVGPTHPAYFNTVAYDSAAGKHDFILRRLLQTPAYQ